MIEAHGALQRKTLCLVGIHGLGLSLINLWPAWTRRLRDSGFSYSADEWGVYSLCGDNLGHCVYVVIQRIMSINGT